MSGTARLQSIVAAVSKGSIYRYIEQLTSPEYRWQLPKLYNVTFGSSLHSINLAVTFAVYSCAVYASSAVSPSHQNLSHKFFSKHISYLEG